MDYLGQLAATALNQTSSIQPRLASRFEPARAAAPLLGVEAVASSEDVVHEASAPAVPIQAHAPRVEREAFSYVHERKDSVTSHEDSPPTPRSRSPYDPDVPHTQSERAAAPPQPPSPPALSTQSERMLHVREVQSVVTPRFDQAIEGASVQPGTVATGAEPAPVVPHRPTRAEVRASHAEHRPSARTVRVTIGRIDVRANLPAPAPATPEPKRIPQLSLDEYLRAQRGGAR